MISMLRLVASIALAICLSGCIFYGRPHRHWHPAYYGHPGYWR